MQWDAKSLVIEMMRYRPECLVHMKFLRQKECVTNSNIDEDKCNFTAMLNMNKVKWSGTISKHSKINRNPFEVSIQSASNGLALNPCKLGRIY